ncbi:hypothetical protein CR513_46359, partial [Mucuna pruriens]
MEGPSVDWENLFPKSKFMMSYIRELGEKLDKVGKGLDSMQRDAQCVNAKVEALSRENDKRPNMVSMHESGGSYEGENLSESGRSSQSSMGERCERYVRVERNRKDERRERHGRRGKEPMEEELDMSKCKIPPFMVVRLVTLEFGDYALVWWTQVLEDIRRGEKYPCEDWVALKKLIRNRFVPPCYTMDLHNKLQRLYQGSRSVEEYHNEMEMDLMRAQIRESEETTLARFLHGLNREIQDVVELQHYRTLGELVHQAIKVEMQIRRKSASRKTYVGTSC